MKRMLPIVVAIAALSVLAWFIGQNVRVAMNRSDQKRTMADMRTIATAWEARATDINSYSVGRAPSDGEQRVTPAQLAAALEPKYVKQFPRRDGWGNEYELTLSEFMEGRAQVYAIRSLGSDGRLDRNRPFGGAITNFADDLIYSNGTFIQFPEASG